VPWIRALAEYIYVVNGERLSRVRVHIQALGEQRGRVLVRYVDTALLLSLVTVLTHKAMY
jgi:hypothetical protein